MKFVARVGLTAATAAAFIAGCTGVASAHDGGGDIVVESQQDSASETEFTIRVTWQNDGHPAADATVTATAVDPAGVPQTPAVLTAVDTDGRYRGAVPFGAPGVWTVRFSVVEPTATAEATRTVVEPTTTTELTTTTEAQTSDNTVEPDFNPDDSGGGTTQAVIGLGILLAIIATAVIGFARSSKKLR